MAVSYEFDTRVRSGVASAAGARTYVVALLKLIRSDPQIECPHESMIRPGRHQAPASNDDRSILPAARSCSTAQRALTLTISV